MITVKIGEAARKAALARTGHDPGETITLDFSDADEAARAALARYYDAQSQTVAATGSTDATLEAVCSALLARAQADDARAAAEQAEREQLAADAREHLAHALTLPVDAWIDECGRACMPVPPGYYPVDHYAYYDVLREIPEYQARLAEAKRVAEARAEEARAAAARAEAERERAEAEQEAAKASYLAAWVHEHGDEALKAQYADGLLCRRELLGLVADWALAGLPPEHAVATCGNRDCPCGTYDSDCIPRSLYHAWRDLRALLPEGTTWQFERSRDCQGDWDDEGDGAGESYYTITVKVPVGPFKFTRRIKLG